MAGKNERQIIQKRDGGEEGDISIGVSEDGLKADVFMSYVKVVGLEILGRPLAWSLNLLRRCQIFVWREHGTPIFMNSSLAYQREKLMVLIKAYHFTFSPAFNNYFRGFPIKNEMLKLPTEMLTTHECTHFGRSSYTWRVRMFPDKHSNKELLQVDMRHMAVSADGRASVPFKNYLDPSYVIPEQTGGVKYEVPPLPSDISHSGRKEIIDKYIDLNDHVNYKVYIWSIMELTLACFTLGKYKNNRVFGEDIRLLPMKEFIIVFHGESMLGDTLDLVTWDKEEEPGTIYTHIYKKEKLLVHSIVKYNINVSGNASEPTSATAKL